MLARGLLCRLTVDAPGASTHDLPQLARLLQRCVLRPNALASSAKSLSLRSLNAALANSHRSYATTTRATKPTTTVKRAVKKAAAKKPAKKPTSQSKKKGTVAKPRRKTTAKKAKSTKAAKPKKARKVLTPEEKEKKAVTELRRKALREPVTPKKISAWQAFVAESLRGTTGNTPDGKASAFKVAGDKFKNLTPAEKEHYNHLANDQSAANQAEYTAWVRSFTPDQIRIANNARALLRRKLKGTRKGNPAHTQKIDDDRQVKRVASPYNRFFVERHASGDLKGIASTEALKLIANEFKALNANEKQKYIDAFRADQAKHRGEYEKTYGHAA